MRDHLAILFDESVYDYFGRDIITYAHILINRVDAIFDDVDAEAERAANELYRS
jgi:hypothetical protein